MTVKNARTNVKTKKMDTLTKLMQEKNYEAAEAKIKTMLKTKDDLSLYNYLLECKLNFLGEDYEEKLDATDELSNSSFWLKVREIIKINNKYMQSAQNSETKELNITSVNREVKGFEDKYKKMLTDLEYCQNITKYLKKYLEYQQSPEIGTFKRRKAIKKSTNYLFDLLGIEIARINRVNRDMTFNYYTPKGDIESTKIITFPDLEGILKNLIENFDNYKFLVSSGDNQKKPKYF